MEKNTLKNRRTGEASEATIAPSTDSSNNVSAVPNIFLYVPNCIGYIRIVLLAASFYYMLHNYKIAIVLYLMSQFLDAFDGLAARLLDQSTLFGSMLDQLTDRVSSMCLLMTLGHFYSDYFYIFQLITALDISSHWLHFFSSAMQGKNSHKTSDLDTHPIIRMYYENRSVLFIVCCMYELFFCLLVVYYYNSNYYIQLALYTCFPIVAFKTLINIIQMVTACKLMARIDQAHLYNS